LSKIEIRTPTFKRASLLRRALQSLLNQTFAHWRCVVIDDDPKGVDTRRVCEELCDDRIMYKQNDQNFGLGANIDQAFSLAPSPGSTHLCVLEDDNYYLPDYLEDNLRVMEQNKVDIVLRNLMIEMPHLFSESGFTGMRTAYQGQYVEGPVTKEELWGSLFYNTGVYNANLFWRTGCGLNFSTLDMSGDPIFQERLRTLCIDRPAYIAMTPKIVWRDNGAESKRASSPGFRWRLNQIRAATRERELYLMLFAHLRDRDFERHIWQSRFRPIDAYCERVFRRVGIRTQFATKLSSIDRVSLFVKRELAKLASAFVVEPINFQIGKERVEARR
jgi:glycosyltransferase involved in cell wall biosynthesis